MGAGGGDSGVSVRSCRVGLNVEHGGGLDVVGGDGVLVDAVVVVCRLDVVEGDRVLVEIVVVVCRLDIGSDVVDLRNASAGTGLVEIVGVAAAKGVVVGQSRFRGLVQGRSHVASSRGCCSHRIVDRSRHRSIIGRNGEQGSQW